MPPNTSTRLAGAALVAAIWLPSPSSGAGDLDLLWIRTSIEQEIPAQLGPDLELDERLQRVAEVLARHTLDPHTTAEQGRGFTLARMQLWEEGSCAAVFATMGVSFDGVLTVDTVISAARGVGGIDRFDRFGVAIAFDDRGLGRAVVAFGRRDADLEEPNSWAMQGNRELRLWLRPGLRDPRVERIGPDGTVEQVTTRALDDGGHVLTIRGEHLPGVHRLEVRAKDGTREVLVGIHAAEAPGAASAPDDPAKFVHRLIDVERARYDLPPLQLLEPLSSIAATHSKSMRDGLSFGHESPMTPDARIAAAGVLNSVALENVSRASSLPWAVTLFMASPGHRANVLDPRVTHLGVGVARSEPLAWYVTADFVRWLPPRDREAAVAAARDVIGSARARPLKSKRVLDEIAQRWCDEVARVERDHLTEEQVSTLTDEVNFHMRDAQRVLVDLAIVEEVEQVSWLPEIHRDEFDQYGLGLVQDERGGMVHLLVILVDRKTQ